MKKIKKDLRGCVAIVTGAANGIGFCFCRDLAARAADVIMVDIDGERLERQAATLREEFPYVDFYTFRADLTKPESRLQLKQYAESFRLPPNILVNNAGIFNFSPIGELPESRIRCYLDLHIEAVTDLTVWFATQPKKDSLKRFILNMSSMSCWMPLPGIGMYAATKAYIRVFSRALHYELKGTDISVTAACPGGIATNLFGLPEPLKKFAVKIGAIDTPERFAHNAISKMRKGKKQYINGFFNRLLILTVGLTPTPLRMAVKRHLLDKGIRV